MPSRRTRGVRGAFAVGGCVATVAGLHTMVAGARSVPGEGAADAAIESELRYYGTFYAAYGLAALRAAARAEPDPVEMRALAATLLAAGLARAGGWRAAGRPHPAQRVLLAIEVGGGAAALRRTAWRS